MYETVIHIDGCYYNFAFNKFGYWSKTKRLEAERHKCVYYKTKYALYTRNLIMVYLAEVANS